jgi:hypothetical protein
MSKPEQVRVFTNEDNRWALWSVFCTINGLDPDMKYHTPEYEYWYKQFDMWRQGTSFGIDANQDLLERNNTLDSMASVFQRADRILANIPVNILFTEQGDTPAYSDGKNITFNGKLIRELNEDTVQSLTGLNYHELAHLLYSPRASSKLGKFVTENIKTPKHSEYTDENGKVIWSNDWIEERPNQKRLMAFNILEDSRAETYLANKYPSVRPFLSATISDYLITNQDSFAENFMLLCGRKYYPIEVRQLSADLHIAKYGLEKTKTIFNIVNEYRTLIYPRQYARGMELIKALEDILPDDLNKCPKGSNGCGGRGMFRNGRPASEGEQAGLAELFGEPDLNLNPSDPDNPSNNGNGRGAGGKANEDNNEPDNTDFAEITRVDIAEKIKTALEQAKSDKSLQKKVKELTNAISKSLSMKPAIATIRTSTYAPEQHEVRIARLFAQELERLRIDCDPNWQREVPSGKLNVRRAMNADINDINKLFDRWREGSDDYEIECSVLVDRSSSMYSLIGSASRAGWIIKRAVEQIEGKVSLMTFSDDSRIILDRDTKAKGGAVPIPNSTGSTNPVFALIETNRIMANTNAKTKLVFIVTDGQFNDNETADQYIQKLQEQGCYVAVVFLADNYLLERWNDPETWWGKPENQDALKHNADIFRLITEPLDLVKLARQVVKDNVKLANRV